MVDAKGTSILFVNDTSFGPKYYIYNKILYTSGTIFLVGSCCILREAMFYFIGLNTVLIENWNISIKNKSALLNDAYDTIGLVQDCSVSSALAIEMSSLALSHRCVLHQPACIHWRLTELASEDTFTVETLYSTIYYSKYFIELNFDKSTQYVALWTHKRHPIPRPFGRAMECLLWVFQQKLTVL